MFLLQWGLSFICKQCSETQTGSAVSLSEPVKYPVRSIHLDQFYFKLDEAPQNSASCLEIGWAACFVKVNWSFTNQQLRVLPCWEVTWPLFRIIVSPNLLVNTNSHLIVGPSQTTTNPRSSHECNHRRVWQLKHYILQQSALLIYYN